MSIHNIPDRYLNTIINIFRNSEVVNDIGDIITTKAVAYASIKANVQVGLRDTVEVKYEIQGRTYTQDHVAYLNRVDGGILRQILPGDIAVDTETRTQYMILAIQEWQSANPNITDSHHIKLMLKAVTGFPGDELASKTIATKGRITT